MKYGRVYLPNVLENNNRDMPKAKDYFKKAGGINLLRQYWSNGVLSTAVAQFLLLGKNRTALEILRLSVDLKMKYRFLKKYRHVLKDFNEHSPNNLSHIKRKTIWLFWWQGEDAMPLLVKRCYDSVKEQLKDWEIVLLTEQNYLQYVAFPSYIQDKLKCGIITLTHFSDLLRLELLIKHGGLWMDATVLCTGSDIPQSILNSELFVYRPQKPGANGKATTISSWLIWAKTNNRILMATLTLLYSYWKTNNRLNEYFLLHHFMSIVLDFYSEDAKSIPPFCNSVPHILLLHLFDKYDEQYWEDLKRMTCFHKLSYKLDEEKKKKEGTYYRELIIDNKR